MKRINKEIGNCDECYFYKYFRCHGYDCDHPDAPDEDERGEEEPLAENRENDFPKWCPLQETPNKQINQTQTQARR